MPGQVIETLFGKQPADQFHAAVLAQLAVWNLGKAENGRFGKDVAEIDFRAADQVIGAPPGLLGQREGAADCRRATDQLDLQDALATFVDLVDQGIERLRRRAADGKAACSPQGGFLRLCLRCEPRRRRDRNCGSKDKQCSLFHVIPPHVGPGKGAGEIGW